MRVLQRAVELGANFIVTVDFYGPFVSEELIAEELYSYPHNLVIGTEGRLIRTGLGERFPLGSSGSGSR